MTRTATLAGKLVTAVVAFAVTLSLVGPTAQAAGQDAAGHGGAVPVGAAPLTNLAHLDFLTDRVPVRDSASNSTYRLDAEPEVGVLWVYADARGAGTFERVGGGKKHPATGHYEQGAYDADDIARAAVVYLRQWRATGVDANASKKHLQGLASRLDIPGRSSMSKDELVKALQKANDRETARARRT